MNDISTNTSAQIERIGLETGRDQMCQLTVSSFTYDTIRYDTVYLRALKS